MYIYNNNFNQQIFSIDKNTFKAILKNEELYLPIRWNNNNFVLTLQKLYREYTSEIRKQFQTNGYNRVDTKKCEDKIKKVCYLIIEVVKAYLNGLPAEAFKKFDKVMKTLNVTPLKIYGNNDVKQFNYPDNEKINLYRVASINDNSVYDRSRIFHVPFNLRSKISTNRYSIAGYPSLYLASSIELCCEEIHYNHHEQLGIVSRFELNKNINPDQIEIIELGIKPQDFIEEHKLMNRDYMRRRIDKSHLNKTDVYEAYLLWYPLIAACSFIRVNKKDPFSVEYVIPQILMQWIRTKLNNNEKLIGVRYFSCASVKASDMGFNYVFPAIKENLGEPFCPVLNESFKLTKPYYLHEFNKLYECEYELNDDDNLDHATITEEEYRLAAYYLKNNVGLIEVEKAIFGRSDNGCSARKVLIKLGVDVYYRGLLLYQSIDEAILYATGELKNTLIEIKRRGLY